MSKLRASDRVVVMKSTHGMGTFARRLLIFDSVVGRVYGQVTRDDSLDPRYCMELEDDLLIIPNAPFRYMNHSCDPNCEIFMWEEGESDNLIGSKPLYVAALRDIKKGEELTIDYAWPAWFAIECGCSADSCRGWIVDPEEIDEIGQSSESEEPIEEEIKEKFVDGEEGHEWMDQGESSFLVDPDYKF